MKKKYANMISGPLLPAIIRYTIPIICTSILQLLFNATDLVIVGQFRGSDSVGAVGATTAITNLLLNLFMGLSVGTSVTVAHALGAKQNEKVHRAIHTAIPMALAGGLILSAVGVPLAGTLLSWMGTPADILPLSTRYMRIIFCGTVFNLTYNFCASILRAAGDTKGPLIYLSIAGVLNVCLNIIFVAVLGMNVEGVALPTIIAQALSAFLVLRALMRRTDACRLELRRLRFYKPQFMKILRIGLPAGIQGSLFSISNVTIMSAINSFDKIVVSGNAAAQNLEGFVYTSMNAFQQTAVNFTGQNVGAGKYDRVKKIVAICLSCTAITGLVLGCGGYLLGRQLLSIYLPDSPEAIQYGLLRMTYIFVPYFICGMMDTATGSLRGIGASTVPMIICVLGVVGIRIGWTAFLFPIPRFHTLESLYISYPVSWFLTFTAELIAFLILLKKHIARHGQPT